MLFSVSAVSAFAAGTTTEITDTQQPVVIGEYDGYLTDVMISDGVTKRAVANVRINSYATYDEDDGIQVQMIFSSSYKARRMIIVIKRPMFMPDATSGGFLLDFCLYRYKIKPFIHHFSPLMAVVCPSETPSVLSGINRIQRWSQSKPLYLVFIAFFVSIYSVLVKRQGVTSGINIRLDTRKVALLSPAPSIQARGNRCSQA